MEKNIQKIIQRPDRNLTPSEELERYEIILDYYLEYDLEQFIPKISTSLALTRSHKNRVYVSDVIFDIESWLNTPFQFENRGRISAKVNYLKAWISFYESKPQFAPFHFDIIDKNFDLINILKQEIKE